MSTDTLCHVTAYLDAISILNLEQCCQSLYRQLYQNPQAWLVCDTTEFLPNMYPASFWKRLKHTRTLITKSFEATPLVLYAPRLTTLWLYSIPDFVEFATLALLPHLTTLHISNSYIDRWDHLEDLQQLHTLKLRSIMGNTLPHTKLAQLRNLRTCSLDAVCCSNFNQALQPLTQLQELTMCYTNCKPVTCLPELTNLRSLSLGFLVRKTGPGSNPDKFVDFTQLTQLHALELNSVCTDQINQLAHLTNLRVLKLCNFRDLKIPLRILRPLTRLQHLRFCNVKFQPGHNWPDLPLLETLTLHKVNVRNPRFLTKYPRLETLYTDKSQVEEWTRQLAPTKLKLRPCLDTETNN